MRSLSSLLFFGSLTYEASAWSPVVMSCAVRALLIQLPATEAAWCVCTSSVNLSWNSVLRVSARACEIAPDFTFKAIIV